jgi:hypothetical protein
MHICAKEMKLNFLLSYCRGGDDDGDGDGNATVMETALG